jgi:hypothetical protein
MSRDPRQFSTADNLPTIVGKRRQGSLLERSALAQSLALYLPVISSMTGPRAYVRRFTILYKTQKG